MTEADMEHPSDGSDEDGIWARATAPQTPYTSRQVGIGLVIFVIGVVVTFGVPLVLT